MFDRSIRWSVLTLASAALLAAAGCADNTEEAADDESGALSGNGGTSAIWPADRKRLVLESQGGGEPFAAPGSTCQTGAAKYTLEIATRKLSWVECPYVEGAPLRPKQGERVLSTTELGTIDAKMNTVRPSTQRTCAEDAPLSELTVTTSRGSKTYTDELHGCLPNRTFVENLSPLFLAFSDLARGIAPVAGSFKLYDAPRVTPDSSCDVHTLLVLGPANKATVREALGGTCELFVSPNERSFELSGEGDGCGSKIFTGTSTQNGVTRAIRITDNRTRVCEDVIAATIVVEESITAGAPAETRRLYSFDGAR